MHHRIYKEGTYFVSVNPFTLDKVFDVCQFSRMETTITRSINDWFWMYTQLRRFFKYCRWYLRSLATSIFKCYTKERHTSINYLVKKHGLVLFFGRWSFFNSKNIIVFFHDAIFNSHLFEVEHQGERFLFTLHFCFQHCKGTSYRPDYVGI